MRNSGAISADGGIITLTAAAVRQTINSLVDNSGTLQADSVGKHNGVITLYAAGTVSNSGSISASGASGGQVAMQASVIVENGSIHADGSNGAGGSVNISFSKSYSDNASSVINANGTSNGGVISLLGQRYGHARCLWRIQCHLGHERRRHDEHRSGWLCSAARCAAGLLARPVAAISASA